MYRTFTRKQSKHNLSVKFCEMHHDCKCCDSTGGANVGAYVGTVGNIGEQASTASRLDGEHGNGYGRGARLSAIVGPVAIAGGKGNSNRDSRTVQRSQQ